MDRELTESADALQCWLDEKVEATEQEASAEVDIGRSARVPGIGIGHGKHPFSFTHHYTLTVLAPPTDDLTAEIADRFTVEGYPAGYPNFVSRWEGELEVLRRSIDHPQGGFRFSCSVVMRTD